MRRKDGNDACRVDALVDLAIGLVEHLLQHQVIVDGRYEDADAGVRPSSIGDKTVEKTCAAGTLQVLLTAAAASMRRVPGLHQHRPVVGIDLDRLVEIATTARYWGSDRHGDEVATDVIDRQFGSCWQTLALG